MPRRVLFLFADEWDRAIARDPPSSVSVLPGESNGDRVTMCITPDELFGPYNAAEGPSTISMRSMSSLTLVNKNGTFTRSEGTVANR